MGLPRARAGRVTLVVTLLGLAVSAYLTAEHFSSSSTLACPATAAFNCAKVTTSEWSAIAGVPVALLGLLFFAAMTALTFVRVRWARDLQLIGAVVGILLVLWLVYVELFLVESVCLWCTGVHVLTVVLLGTTIWWRESARTSPTGVGVRTAA